MEEGKQGEQAIRHKPLKELYPDVELRRKYAAQKLQSNKGHNQIIVRCEPHPKYSQIMNAPYLIFLAPASYQVAYISATIQTRVIAKLGPEKSTFLFCNKKLVTAFRQNLGTFWAKNREEDNILYLQYSDTAGF